MEQFCSAFEAITNQKLVAEEYITGSGSNRQYIRLKGETQSLIGVIGESIPENIAFIELTKHFHNQGFSVPELLYVSEDKTRYIQQDLGDLSLFEYIKQGRKTGKFSVVECEMLAKTIRKLAEIQFIGTQGLDFSVCYPQPEFDKRTVLWDLNYFKYCFLKPSNVPFLETKLEDDFETMASILLKNKTNTFLYRDFQSRNVMIFNNEPYFIDYQGGRKGPIFYDVASFLWQAKANFSDELRNKLIDAAGLLPGNGHAVHQKARNACRCALRNQLAYRAVLRHGNGIKFGNELCGLRSDGFRVDVGMRVDDGHVRTLLLQQNNLSYHHGETAVKKDGGYRKNRNILGTFCVKGTFRMVLSSYP